MTLSEFKAWFSGYTESIEGQPTEKQWARVKARVDEIDNMPTTQTIYIDRYWSPYRSYYPPYWACGNSSSLMAVGAVNNLSMASGTTPRSASATQEATINSVWDSGIAMMSLGKADAQADAA